MQRPERRAGRLGLVREGRGRQRPFGLEVGEGVDPVLGLGDASQVRGHHLPGRSLARSDQVGERGGAVAQEGIGRLGDGAGRGFGRIGVFRHGGSQQGGACRRKRPGDGGRRRPGRARAHAVSREPSWGSP